MSNLIGRRVCQAACVLSILMAISATCSIVTGFVNIGTFHATDISTTVGIWCGLCMYLQVFLGLLLMGTRQKFVAALYLLVSLVCIGVSAVGIYFSKVYYDEFDTFSDYNTQVRVGGKETFCDFRIDQCQCFKDNQLQVFKDGFQFLNCPLIHFGKDLWTATMVFVVFNTVFAFAGTVIGFWASGSDSIKDGYGR